MRRVVITGMAVVSPIGNDWETISENLRSCNTGIKYMENWECYEEMITRLGAPATDFKKPDNFTRKQVRSMGRVALMATDATERALQDSQLLDDPEITNGRMGVGYGSSTGSTEAVKDFGNMLLNNSSCHLNANTYLKMMSHTAAVNIGVFLD